MYVAYFTSHECFRSKQNRSSFDMNDLHWRRDGTGGGRGAHDSPGPTYAGLQMSSEVQDDEQYQKLMRNNPQHMFMRDYVRDSMSPVTLNLGDNDTNETTPSSFSPIYEEADESHLNSNTSASGLNTITSADNPAYIQVVGGSEPSSNDYEL